MKARIVVLKKRGLKKCGAVLDNRFRNVDAAIATITTGCRSKHKGQKNKRV
jgi:hypothetical protein